MKTIFLSFLIISSILIAQPISQTFIIPGDQESFTDLMSLQKGQAFQIESLEGVVSFQNASKERDAQGRDYEGKLCVEEGGMVVLFPGGNYHYATRNEGHGCFWEFAERLVGKKIHALSSGILRVKVFDQEGKYKDNQNGFYKITVKIYPYNPQDSQIPRPAFYKKLAFHWAPIHYQDCAKSHWKADALTKINYDGDWKTNNNWNNLYSSQADLRGAVYYSVVETESHWFIIYAFFHPRDWMDPWDIDTEHENDMEGIIALVQKVEGLCYGKLEGIITHAHLDFYSYVPNDSTLQANQESIDGKLIWKLDSKGIKRFCTYQEAKGHGCYALQKGSSFGWDKDYFIYYPVLKNPTAPKSRFDKNVHYVLIDIFEENGLWARRFDSQVFESFGLFHKTHGSGGNAKTPWKWDDWNDGPQLKGGEMAFKPALLFSIYYIVPNLSPRYIYNPYQGIWNP